MNIKTIILSILQFTELYFFIINKANFIKEYVFNVFLNIRATANSHKKLTYIKYSINSTKW